MWSRTILGVAIILSPLLAVTVMVVVSFGGPGVGASLRWVEVSVNETTINTLRAGRIRSTSLPLDDSIEFVWNLTWSPDGNRIAFGAQRAVPGGNSVGEVYVYDLNTDSMSLLVSGRRVGTQIAWSPEGNRIAFDAVIPPEPGEVWLGDLSTLTAEQIVLRGLESVVRDSSLPAWSPVDANELALVAVTEDQQVQLLMVGVDDGSAKPLVSGNDFYSALRWSPDGRYLSYRIPPVLNRRMTGTAYHLLDLLTGRARALSHSTAYTYLGSWSQDGQYLALAGSQRNLIDIVHVESNRLTLRFRQPASGTVGQFVWSPEYSVAALTVYEGRDCDLFVIDLNWGIYVRIVPDARSCPAALTWNND